MQRDLTIQDVRDAFWDWQCWWFVAKSTGNLEDIGALCCASEKYERVCNVFLERNPHMTWDEREAYIHFREEYDRMIENDVVEAERE